MVNPSRILSDMGTNPRADWTIGDIERICSHYGIDCVPPTGGGSHYKINSRHLEGILTVPAKRPIKPVYIRKFTSYVAAHRSAGESSDE